VHALTNEQQKQLASWLLDEAPSQTLSLTAVKGYLFAIIASPDPIDVNQWLPLIFNQQMQEVPDEITLIIAQLYNGISDQMFDTGYELPPTVECSDMFEANFLSGHPLHEWSLGFACGVNFYSQNLFDNLAIDSEINETFSLSLMAMTYFADREIAEEVVAQQEQTTISQFTPVMYQMIVDLVADYAQIVEQAALSTGLYDEEIGDDEWDSPVE